MLHSNGLSKSSLRGLHCHTMRSGLICLNAYQVFHLAGDRVLYQLLFLRIQLSKSCTGAHLIDSASDSGYVCFLHCLLATSQTQRPDNPVMVDHFMSMPCTLLRQNSLITGLAHCRHQQMHNDSLKRRAVPTMSATGARTSGRAAAYLCFLLHSSHNSW